MAGAATLAALCALACEPRSRAPATTALTPATHTKFPISSGVHAVSCNVCHGDFGSFRQFTCFNCHGHEQPLTDELHRSLVTVGTSLPDGGAGYAYSSTSCLACHATGSRVAFDHVGIASSCSTCHGSGAPFDPLPVAGTGLDGGSFVHPDKRGNDCSACHTTRTWVGGAGAPDGVRDPTQDLNLTAQIPSYAGTAIVAFTAQSQALPMPMVHSSAAVPPAAQCFNCHADASAGAFFPGRMHASLAGMGVAQPATCLDCHAPSVPRGFVGPVDASRSPASGEMKHDAVLWSNGAPGKTAAAPQECALCHQPPPAAATWATPASFHASLTSAGQQQPSSCLDCHANSRPAAAVNAPAGAPQWQFDHATGAALGDCTACHLGTTPAAQYTSWTGGRFHQAGSAAPKTCLPCHAAERPTSTTGWTSTSYQGSPFDYGTNGAGTTHGAGQDCILCHAAPSGGTETWANGSFGHASATLAGRTCISCHSTQRPDLNGFLPAQILDSSGQPFDHAKNGTGDCFGCHQATSTRGSYLSYQPIPGSDWRGGVGYPGSTLISAPGEFVTVTETTLNRSGPNNLVTSTSSITATLYNAMLHTSSQVPAQLQPASSTDWPKCSQCHAVDSTGAGTLAGGKFHLSLTNLALPQPTLCLDCHAQMRPAGIVELSSSGLQPMDHDALFATGSVTQMDCASCHKSPGSTWADGVFHANIGAARPQDCTVCHYPVMADAAAADLTSGASFSMRHKSAQLTFQNCQSCHATALAKATAQPLAAALWSPGTFHSSVTVQPTACNECHTVSTPAAATQSSFSYTLALGATATNQRQWMNHASPSVVGKDCAVCHAADAIPGAASWSKGDSYHAAVASPQACSECHGTGNGGGSVPGTNNNLPSGLTNASMVTTAASDPSTGVPAGTPDQITHADVNASAHDCRFCHAQAGPSTAAGIQGREWAQAAFHTSFTAASPLIANGSTGRCSNCHLNVKPGPSYTAQDHSTFTAAPGTQDCALCHSWPGTGTSASPNWLGASAAPQFISVGGFAIPVPPAPSPRTQAGIANLPHPAGTTCTACHATAGGGRPAIGYDHASSLINANCSACHEAGSDLVGTAWNRATSESAGAGDTRPFTLASVPATYKGNTSIETNPNHFFLDRAGAQVDCKWCHVKPPSTTNANVTTGSAYCCGTGSAWQFKHPPESPTYDFCWQCHTNGPPN